MRSAAGGMAKYLFVDLAGSVIRFPVWWYTSGASGVARWLVRELGYRWKSYNFVIWMRNFFVPMYGQYDWSGRLVSVFMRFVVLVGRIIALAIEAVVYVALFALWLAAPPLSILFLLLNLTQGIFSYG